MCDTYTSWYIFYTEALTWVKNKRWITRGIMFIKAGISSISISTLQVSVAKQKKWDQYFQPIIIQIFFFLRIFQFCWYKYFFLTCSLHILQFQPEDLKNNLQVYHRVYILAQVPMLSGKLKELLLYLYWWLYWRSKLDFQCNLNHLGFGTVAKSHWNADWEDSTSATIHYLHIGNISDSHTHNLSH